MRSIILILFLLFSLPLLAQKNKDVDNIGNRDINKGSINFISLEKEIALGAAYAAEIEKSVKLVNDPVITEYVNRVGQNIVRNSDAKVPFTIKVIESDEINAFALPGGFFYVNSGLILAADEEAELAAVMAHEIAHVAARHGTENASKSQLIGTIAQVGTMMIGGGVAGYGIRQALGLIIPLQFLQFSRKAESEADYLGIQYLYKTGYDPSAAVEFFEKLQAKEAAKPQSVSKLFSTHPPTGDRVEASKKTIETILPSMDQYVITTSEFNVVKARLMEQQNVKPVNVDNNKPSLKRKSAPKEDPKVETKPEDREPDPDDRPTLKRRPNDYVSVQKRNNS